MEERAGESHVTAAGEIAPTFRWRRREVFKVRVTWLGMVLVLCLMTHRAILNAWPALGMGSKVLAFVAVVVLPMLLLGLWRLGLLPPERVRCDAPPER